MTTSRCCPSAACPNASSTPNAEASWTPCCCSSRWLLLHGGAVEAEAPDEADAAADEAAVTLSGGLAWKATSAMSDIQLILFHDDVSFNFCWCIIDQIGNQKKTIYNWQLAQATSFAGGSETAVGSARNPSKVERLKSSKSRTMTHFQRDEVPNL